MTVHASATRIALSMLPDTWQVGMVLMNQNCPAYLRTDEPALESDTESLARDFGRRVIVTDRFAVAVSSRLRRRAVALAKGLGLRMQTHLNEQITEKEFVEKKLYPQCASYTDVYRRDGVLDCAPILAHCIHMRPDEFDLLASRDALIAHCPVSNTLLESGVMPLDEVVARGLSYVLCTDIGASPTTSLLCEMVQFLKVHARYSSAATAEEALRRVTVVPAKALGFGDRFGEFEPGKEMSYVEVRPQVAPEGFWTARETILQGLLGLQASDLPRAGETSELGDALDHLRRGHLDNDAELERLTADVRGTTERLDQAVQRVTLAGRTIWERKAV
jgi:guanine deaminase